MIKVNFRDLIIKEFPSNTSLKEISSSFKKYFNYPIMIAKIDNNLVELSEELDKKCNIDFYDRESGVGNSIYGRSLQFLLILAVRRVLGENALVVVEHSIDKGFYCEVNNVDDFD